MRAYNKSSYQSEIKQLTENEAYSSSRVFTSSEDLEWTLVDEIRDARLSNSPRHSMLFYHVVYAGNFSVVRGVLQKLKQSSEPADLDFAVGAVVDTHTPQETSTALRARRVVIFLLSLLFMWLLCPLFYSIHAFIKYALEAGRTSLVKKMNVPLVFAVLSGSPEMVELFFHYKASLEFEDQEGNNTCHYLADMSSDVPEKCLKMTKILTKYLGNNTQFRRCLNMPNHRNETPLHIAAKYGSLQYLNYLAKFHGCFGEKLKFAVSEQTVWLRTTKGIFNVTTNTTLGPKDEDFSLADTAAFGWEVGLKDTPDRVGRDNSDTVTLRSTDLLCLIAKKNVAELPEADTSTIVNSRQINRWIDIKKKKLTIACLVSHFFSLLFTVLLVIYVYEKNGDMNLSPLSKIFFAEWKQLALTNVTIHEQDIMVQLYNTCDHKMSLQKIEDNVYGNFFLHIPGVCAPDDTLACFAGFGALVLASFSILIFMGNMAVFLKNHYNFQARKWWEALTPALSNLLPGSYVEKQMTTMSMFLAWLTMLLLRVRNSAQYDFAQELTLYNNTREAWLHGTVSFETQKLHLEELKEKFNYSEDMIRICSVTVVLCLVIRVLMAIHAMRLLPVLGFYIITMIKMAADLMRFAVVFSVFVLAFALLFGMTIRSEKCPALADVEYRTFWDSLYSTFNVILNTADTSVFSDGLNTRIIYLACSFLIVVMLMNLVIALMTTTATNIGSEPWQAALLRCEFLNEVLGIELDLMTLKAPFKCIHRRRRRQNRPTSKERVKKVVANFTNLIYYDTDKATN